MIPIGEDLVQHGRSLVEVAELDMGLVGIVPRLIPPGKSVDQCSLSVDRQRILDDLVCMIEDLVSNKLEVSRVSIPGAKVEAVWILRAPELRTE